MNRDRFFVLLLGAWLLLLGIDEFVVHRPQPTPVEKSFAFRMECRYAPGGTWVQVIPGSVPPSIAPTWIVYGGPGSADFSFLAQPHSCRLSWQVYP